MQPVTPIADAPDDPYGDNGPTNPYPLDGHTGDTLPLGSAIAEFEADDYYRVSVGAGTLEVTLNEHGDNDSLSLEILAFGTPPANPFNYSVLNGAYGANDNTASFDLAEGGDYVIYVYGGDGNTTYDLSWEGQPASTPTTVDFDELTDPVVASDGSAYISPDGAFQFRNLNSQKELRTAQSLDGNVTIHTDNWNSETEITRADGATFDFTSFDASTYNGATETTYVRVYGYRNGLEVGSTDPFTVNEVNLTEQLVGLTNVDRVVIRLGLEGDHLSGRLIEVDNFVFE